jgi:hypothetical protein
MILGDAKKKGKGKRGGRKKRGKKEKWGKKEKMRGAFMALEYLPFTGPKIVFITFIYDFSLVTFKKGGGRKKRRKKEGEGN